MRTRKKSIVPHRKFLFIFLISAFLSFMFSVNFGQHSSQDILPQIQSSLEKCDTSTEEKSISCWKDLSKSLLSTYELKEITQAIDNNTTYEPFLAQCHLFMHYIGQEAYKKSQDFSSTISQCNEFCYDGCYHGVTESYINHRFENKKFTNDLLVESINKEINNLCDTKKNNISDSQSEYCIKILHGIGHALLELTNDDMAESLRLCDNILPSLTSDSCHRGISMASVTNKPTRESLNPNDPYASCRSFENATVKNKSYYVNICYQTISSILFTKDANYNLTLCNKYPDNLKERCYQSLNLGVSDLIYSRNIASLTDYCNQIPSTQLQSICIRTVISDFGGKYMGNYNIFNTLNAFCSMQGRDAKKECYAHIDEAKKSWETSERARNITSIIRNCENELNGRNTCVENTVHTLGKTYKGEYALLATYCSMQDNELKKSCYDQLYNTIRSWTDSEIIRQEVCKIPMDSLYKSFCVAE